MNPISLHVIGKDNLENIKRMTESIRPFVSEIFFLDTGCDANAIEYLNSLENQSNTLVKIVDGRYLISKETGYLSDFAAARNVTWNMGSQPYKMYLDTDDEFVGGKYISDLISRFEEYNVCGSIDLDYRYTHDEKGNCVQCFPGPRIYKTNAIWTRCLHEFVDNKLEKNTYFTEYSKIIYVKHHSNGRGSSQVGNNRNISIISEYFLNHSPKDDPNLFYYFLEEVKIRLQLGRSVGEIYVKGINWFIETCPQHIINETFEKFNKMNPAGAARLIWQDEWVIYMYKQMFDKKKKKSKWRKK